MSDFTPEMRNSAMWSGDARKIANGKANEVILTKLGKMPIPDLSDVEAVQMGHVFEPVIGSLASKRLDIELFKQDAMYSHPEHEWLRTHVDFVGKENGQHILVEAKNYNAAVRGKFDPETGLMPAADRAQCIHEATVFGCSKVYLAVLLGGQEFIIMPLEVTDQMKADHIAKMSEIWSHVGNGTTLPPETLEQTKLLYPESTVDTKLASKSVEHACFLLKEIKEKRKALEAQEEQLQVMIQGYMGECGSLQSLEGNVLATWRSAKPTKSFDSKLFESAMPDVYNKFIMEKTGSRRFLIK